MDLAAELAQFKPEPALAEWVGKLLEKTQKDALTRHQAALKIQQSDLKIQSMTFELAYYKRIRFANKSEQFSTEQRELFEESWNTDTSALEAEVARREITEYIEIFYNRMRKQARLGYLSPAAFTQQYYAIQIAA